MPYYDYYCPVCDYTEEIQHKITETLTPPCPNMCEGYEGTPVAMKRAIGKTNFNLPGPGWAKDGYSKTP